MIERLNTPSGAEIAIAGRMFVNFGGCCYLGLSRESSLSSAGIKALREQGPLGYLPRHYGFALGANLDVEATARTYFAAEATMYFATGYLFGLIAMAGLSGEYDVAILDENAHYNLRDGALAAGKPVIFFKHRDVDDLARAIGQQTSSGARALVATDGMFPTFGAIPPLKEYWDLVRKHKAWLLVDESHSFGVLGPNGRGALEREGIEGETVIAGGSLGKAFCAYGGLAVGSRRVIDMLWTAPAARGAASGMSSGAAMADASMRWLRQHPGQLHKLKENTLNLKAQLRALGLSLEEHEAPIATFVAGSAEQMKALQADLYAEGIYVIYSNYVGAGSEGAIRCAIFADHHQHHFERLVSALKARL